MSQHARPWRMFRSDGQQGGFAYELVAEYPSLTSEQARREAEAELRIHSHAKSVIMIPADIAINVTRKDLSGLRTTGENMAETMAAAPAPPEPIILPDDDQLSELERQLADIEDQYGPDCVPQILLPTLRDAQRAARQMAKIERLITELAAAYDEEIKELRRRIEALERRKQLALRPFERRASWYRAALEQWRRAELERLGGKCLQQNGGETT